MTPMKLVILDRDGTINEDRADFVKSADEWLPQILAQLPLAGRVIVGSAVLAPIAVPVGIPFPVGLRQLAEKKEDLISWAWGANSFFSVMGGSSAVLIAMSWGFTFVTITGLALYILAAFLIVSSRVFPVGGRSSGGSRNNQPTLT